MAQLWRELVDLYGDKAKIKYGEVGGSVFESWCKKLIKLQAEDVVRGLNACIERKQEWPPEQQEFMRLCVDVKRAPCHGEYQSLKKIGVVKATAESCKNARQAALQAAGVV